MVHWFKEFDDFSNILDLWPQKQTEFKFGLRWKKFVKRTSPQDLCKFMTV